MSFSLLKRFSKRTLSHTKQTIKHDFVAYFAFTKFSFKIKCQLCMNNIVIHMCLNLHLHELTILGTRKLSEQTTKTTATSMKEKHLKTAIQI